MSETSRLIVKNIPKKITPERLKSIFAKISPITDCKIMEKNNKSRQIAFIGFKNIEDAKKAKKYFDTTYIDTSKISVSYAYPYNSEQIPRAWSKHSKDSSAFQLSQKTKEEKLKNKRNAPEKDAKQILEEKKKLYLKIIQNRTKSNKVPIWKQNILNKEENQGKEGNVITQDKGEESKINIERISLEKNIIDDSTNDHDPKRLYITNLPFSISEEEVRNYFSSYGEIEKVQLIFNKEGMCKGYAYITYANEEDAVNAYAGLDQTIFQGRILFIKPSLKAKSSNLKIESKKEQKEKLSSFKKSKLEKLNENYDNQVNWNYLFLNANAVLDSTSTRIGMSKMDLINQEGISPAVVLGQSETAIINETKQWLKELGIDTSWINVRKFDCPRSKNVLFVKNISYNSSYNKLKELFERFGSPLSFYLSPSNTLGIVKYDKESHAQNAIKRISGYLFDGNPLYIEYAPDKIKIKISNSEKGKTIQKNENENEIEYEKEKEEITEENMNNKTIFIKNLNFISTEEKLRQVFEEVAKDHIKSVKIVKKNDGSSLGYGFVEMDNENIAKQAVAKLQNTILNDHCLKLNISSKKLSKESIMKKEFNKKVKPVSVEDNPEARSNSSKIIIKNVPFQATKKEISELVKSHGIVKSIKLPKKMDGTIRHFNIEDLLLLNSCQ